MDARKTGLAIIGGVAVIGLLIFVGINFFLINDPKPEECEVQTITIASIEEGSGYDIFITDTSGDRYYINRGLEQGLELNSLKKIGLNQKAIIHLPKFAIGVSEHIAQLTIGDSIIYTEFD